MCRIMIRNHVAHLIQAEHVDTENVLAAAELREPTEVRTYVYLYIYIYIYVYIHMRIFVYIYI